MLVRPATGHRGNKHRRTHICQGEVEISDPSRGTPSVEHRESAEIASPAEGRPRESLQCDE